MIKMTWRKHLVQLQVLTGAGLKSRFRGTVWGFLWVSVGPLITYAAQAIVFSMILKVAVNDYMRFLMSGLLPWLFFSQTLEMATNLFVWRGKVLKNFDLHPFLLILSQALENGVGLTIPFLISVGYAFYSDFNYVLSHLIGLPVVFLILFLFTAVLSFIVAMLQVFFHDTKFILNWALSILFYFTPIIYPLSSVPASLRDFLRFNPLNPIIGSVQIVLGRTQNLSLMEPLLISILILILTSLAAFFLWRGLKNGIYNRI